MRHLRFIPALALLGCAASVGPGDGSLADAAVDVTADQHAVPDTAPDAATPDGACNVLPLGPVVVSTSHPEPTPTLAGGTIAEGTYHLVALDLYNGSTQTLRDAETWSFAGDQVELSEQAGGVPTVYSETLTFRASGAALDLDRTCPTGGTRALPFEASGTALRVAINDGTVLTLSQ